MFVRQQKFLFCFILHFLLKHNTGGHTKIRTRSDTVQAVDKVPRAYMQRNKKKQKINLPVRANREVSVVLYAE